MTTYRKYQIDSQAAVRLQRGGAQVRSGKSGLVADFTRPNSGNENLIKEASR